MDSTSSNRTPPWLNAREQEVWRAFLELSRSMERAVDRQLQRDSELAGSEYEVLVPLSESATGELPSRELLRMLGWERSRLSHMLSRMERRDMIRRSPSPTDARGLVVGITEHGRSSITRAAPAHIAMVRAAFVDQLTEDESAALMSIAHKVVPRLGDLKLA